MPLYRRKTSVIAVAGPVVSAWRLPRLRPKAIRFGRNAPPQWLVLAVKAGAAMPESRAGSKHLHLTIMVNGLPVTIGPGDYVVLDGAGKLARGDGATFEKEHERVGLQ